MKYLEFNTHEIFIHFMLFSTIINNYFAVLLFPIKNSLLTHLPVFADSGLQMIYHRFTDRCDPRRNIRSFAHQNMKSDLGKGTHGV